MHIHCLGLNHNTAEIGLREQLAFSEESLRAALARLGCGRVDSGYKKNGGCSDPEEVSEMVILSTCTRVEVYALAQERVFPELEAFLAEVQAVDRGSFSDSLYQYLDDEAVEHLFRVASGLDSLILGEPQILGQVMNAFELARGQSSVGPVLSRLFQAALHAGKRARTETTISHNPASISSVAIGLAEGTVSNLKATRVLVLGAGEMAELAVEALRKRGVQKIRVVNRTMKRARKLAERWNGEAATFEKLFESMQWADILLASTGAPHIMVNADLVSRAMRARAARPLVIIDIAVPRDVDDEVGELPGVRLYDIDTLQDKLDSSLAKRAGEIPRVEAIIAEELERFREYLDTLDVIPVIAAMNQQAEAIRQAELEKTLRRLPNLGPEERESLDTLTQALVKKILHAPITCLRSEAGSSKSVEYTEAARELFDLDVHNGNGRNGSS
jgi:glutamyl-tRNA reductase